MKAPRLQSYVGYEHLHTERWLSQRTTFFNIDRRLFTPVLSVVTVTVVLCFGVLIMRVLAPSGISVTCGGYLSELGLKVAGPCM